MTVTVLFDKKYNYPELTEEEKRITIEGANQGLSKRQIASLLKTNYAALVSNHNFKNLYNEIMCEKISKIAKKAFELAESGNEGMIRYILDRKGKWNINEDDLLPNDFYLLDYKQKCETLDRLRSEDLISEEGYRTMSKILDERYRYITIDERIESAEKLTKKILDRDENQDQLENKGDKIDEKI